MGSGAGGQEDRWSDIDLALRLAPGIDVTATAEAWTQTIAAHLHHVAHVDVWARGALYRVFLLPDTLQVDVSFWRDQDFAAHGPRFRLVFGEANPSAGPVELDTQAVFGLAWLYAIHVRSSLARGRVWQAVFMLNAVREHVIQLACHRHGLPTHEGRGVDDLPADLRQRLLATVPAAVAPTDLREAFAGVGSLLAEEARYADPRSADRLDPVLAELVRTADPAAR